MKKRIVSLLLAAALIVCLLPVQVFAGETDTWENITWEYSSGVLTVSGTGDMPEATQNWNGDGYFTGSSAPWSHLSIHTVIIEPGITAVGANNFYGMKGLETVQLPDTVAVINEFAFAGCIDLRTVNMPSGLKEIWYGAFSGCESLTGVPLAIPGSVTAIYENAFSGCLGIKGVQFPDSLTYLGSGAFSGSGLMEVTIPAGVTEIPASPFVGCASLESITVDPANPNFSSDSQGVLYNKDKTWMIQVPGGYYGELTVPETVTCLTDHDVLWGCAQLTKIYLPATVTEIANYLFYSCYSLEAIEVDAANPVYEDIIGVLYGPDSAYVNGFTSEPRRSLICCPPAFGRESFFIPDDTQVLEDYAFRNCFYLQDVTIPDRVEYLPNDGFRGCASLYEIWVDAGNPWFQSTDGVVFNKADVTAGTATGTLTLTAGQYLYCYPTGRSGYYAIPEGTVCLGPSSFATSAVQAIRFPESVKYIDMYALEDCGGLEWMLFAGNKPEVNFDCLEGVTAEVHYPAANPTWEDDLRLPDAGGTLTFIPWGPRPADEPVWSGYNPFTDVPEDSFCYDSVLWAVRQGITNGTSDTTFDPLGQCLRAHVVTFLWRAAGSPAPDYRSPNVRRFRDVSSDDFYFPAVMWAVEQGITNGISEREFGPNQPCNRAQVVTFLWRAAGSPTPRNTALSPFEDVTPGDFCYEAVLWAVEQGITNGTDAAHFSPTQTCNRAQVVTFLYRANN